MGLPTIVSSREDVIGDISISNGTNQTYSVSSNQGFPNDRFMFGLRLQVEFRATNPGSAGPTGRIGDAPYSLIDSIIMEGYHKVRQTKEQFINVRTPDLRELTRAYMALAPYTTHASGDLSVTASATNDVRFVIYLPFTPMGMSLRQQMAWLLDCPNYDQLTLKVNWADDKSLFTGQTTAPTFSAFGSATGNPRIRLTGLYAQAGRTNFRGFLPGRVWRGFQEITSGDIVGTATASRLFNLVKGNRLRGLLLKNGAKASTTSSGNNAYNTLSNSKLSNLKIFRGTNKAIRSWNDIIGLQHSTMEAYAIQPSTGYGLIDFAQRGVWNEVLDTTGLTSGATGDVDLFLQGDTAGSAGDGAVLTYEEWRGLPADLSRIPARR